ncbi:MAG: type II secretion system F family protein [Methanobrevibacter sp.]|uniref:type II secretion system F family protein n=1 Tax=Methanobrevibacter sp. TaxID=66852 RepID=UPI0026E0BDD4|nr:type II secretion system F family protein [Methanobrevibacter sp.]MDO5848939.1 type II secretion system F family protein [Methanobrevibacter sp.]
MELKIISFISIFLENKLPEKQLSRFQEFLLSSDIIVDPIKLLSYFIFLFLSMEFVLIILILFLKFSLVILIAPFFIIGAFYAFSMLRQERRISQIENSAPDFLRQLASILKVGLSFESAMEDMSKYGSGPLYDEMRRTLIEIKMGGNFDECWIAMCKRLKSKEIERVFMIILDGRKSGGGIANVIMDISNDLRDILALKRERRSSVMMAVMFLLISAVIASPFSLGMISVYGSFMESFGKTSEVITIAPLAGELYLVIHSFLIGLIISIILYGDFKKGIKFSIPLVLVSCGIFYIISNFAGQILISG